MATNLTLTNSLFISATGFGSANSSGTAYTIVPSDSDYDRRIYGMNVTNTSSVNHLNCTLWLSDGTSNYQMGRININANVGNSISIGATDLFSNSTFQDMLTYSMCDTMSVYYFNLPKTWSLKFTYTNTLSAGNTMSFVTFGEVYGGNTTNHTSEPFSQVTSITNATGTAYVSLLDSSPSDRRIYSINATSTDVTARPMAIYLNDGTTNHLIYTENILANAGNATTIATEDLFYDAFAQGLFVRNADSEGLAYYFNIPAGYSLVGKLGASTAGTINIQVRGEIYG